jgi:lipopolysaccharide transport system permease protein
MKTQIRHEIVLSANAKRGAGYWQDLWRARELLLFLAWRDVLVRYKQATFGILWAVLRPVMTTLVFTLVFGKIARLPAGDIPYALLVLSGMAPWFYFSSTIGECGNSLVANASLITKVYFPRLVVPIGTVLANLIDLAVTCVLIGVLLLIYGVGLKWSMLLIPVILLTLVVLSVGVGLWISAVNAKYRDVQFVLPFMITFGLYLSPVGFSSSVVPEAWRWLYNLNPMVGVIDGFRWMLFGDAYIFQWVTLAYSFGVAIVLVFTGISFFRSVERELVDLL